MWDLIQEGVDIFDEKAVEAFYAKMYPKRKIGFQIPEGEG